MVAVGRIGIEQHVPWLSADFNCTVTDPAYVNAILDRLRDEQPRLFGMLLYVEQPFPYDLEAHRIDAHSVSARKPLFLDESAHDWQLVRLGQILGLVGRRAQDVQDADRRAAQPVLGQGPRHDADGAGPDQPHAGADPAPAPGGSRGNHHGRGDQRMQFYPEASGPEAQVHPGMYRRRHGVVDLSTLGPSGFGYRLDEINRHLPAPDLEVGGG